MSSLAFDGLNLLTPPMHIPDEPNPDTGASGKDLKILHSWQAFWED